MMIKLIRKTIIILIVPILYGPMKMMKQVNNLSIETFKKSGPDNEEPQDNVKPSSKRKDIFPNTVVPEDPIPMLVDVNSLSTHHEESPTHSTDVVTMKTNTTEDTFFYTKDPSEDDYFIFYDEDTKKEEVIKFYDPTDNIPEKDKFGKSIPLTMDCSSFIRTNQFHTFITDLSDDDLFGRDIPFETFTYINENSIFTFTNTTSREDIDIEDGDYHNLDEFFGPDEPAQEPINLFQQFPALATMYKLKKEHQNWDAIQKKLAFFFKDIIIETMKRITQLNRYIQIFPMMKHVKSMFQI